MLYAHYEAVFICYIYISFVGIKKVIIIVQFEAPVSILLMEIRFLDIK